METGGNLEEPGGTYLDVVDCQVAACGQDGAAILEVPLGQFLTDVMKEAEDETVLIISAH